MDFDSKEGLLVVDNQLLESEITALRERLEQMTPNMASIEEYKRKEELHLVRLKELDAVTEGRDEARKEFEGMRKERLDKFMAGFSMITNKLKEMYQVGTYYMSGRRDPPGRHAHMYLYQQESSINFVSNNLMSIYC